MSHVLPNGENEIEKNMCLEEIINTPDDSDFGSSEEIDLKNADNIIQKTTIFPSRPENKVIAKDKYNDYLTQINPKNYTKARKLLCDWSDKKNSLNHYRSEDFS